MAPRTNPIRSASPPAAPPRCRRHSAQICRVKDPVSSLRARTFPTTRICLTGRITKLTHDATMIFKDECKVVNDPGRRTLGDSQHAADVSRGTCRVRTVPWTAPARFPFVSTDSFVPVRSRAIWNSLRARSPSVVSEATADEELVASSESAAVAFDTTT